MPAGRRCGSSSPACSPCWCSVLALVWLARRTRRYVNVPLAAGGPDRARDPGRRRGRARGGQAEVDTTRDGVYAATLSTAQARIAGFDAKSNESLTLIARGSGGAFEKAWQASNAAVSGRAQPSWRRTRRPPA